MTTARLFGPTSPPAAGYLARTCQVAENLPGQCCGVKADQVYRCEMVGPHTRHRIGEHTIRHALAGNGHTCSAINPPA